MNYIESFWPLTLHIDLFINKILCFTGPYNFSPHVISYLSRQWDMNSLKHSDAKIFSSPTLHFNFLLQALITTDDLISSGCFEPPLLYSRWLAQFPQQRPTYGPHPTNDQSIGWQRKESWLWILRKPICVTQQKITPYLKTWTLAKN